MQRRSTVGVWCDRLMEMCWLLAVALIPIYFNLLSARHFEPDKATSLRAIVLVMLGAWIIRGLDQLSHQPTTRPEGEAQPTNPLRAWWKRFSQIPLAVPALVYVLVFLLTTATSVVPRTSFFGSYQRLQGTYTNISYVLLFALMVATMRRREQLERLITVTLLTSSVVAGYGILQHFQLDPLPWRGDVITRVASTMGNSIFVAAYMILVVPFALYRLVDTLNQARNADSGDTGLDIAWMISYLLLIAGCLALLLGVIKFAAIVRTADFRYWWVFPGALTICAWLFAVPTLRVRQSPRTPVAALVPAFVLPGYGVFFALLYQISSSSGLQASDPSAVNALDWNWWMIGGIALIMVFYGLIATLPRSEEDEEPSRLNLYFQALGVGLLVLALLATIFFTQSRGPWLGLFAGMFVFVTLLIWFAMVRARTTSPQMHRLLRGMLIAEMLLALAIGAFLAAFNLSNAPFFAQLRDVPYLGRMGRLLETDEGTGKVRVLIWRGDDKAGGAIALILSDPWRTIVGWGPESMFVAYNKFYPPALANIEARGASPDRSHQAILDELVTKGFLGLVSYLFVLGSFIALAWRLICKSSEWHWQVFFIATLSVVVSHFVEAFVGIPIVATLMMLWVTLAVTVVGGHLAGVYQLGPEERPAPQPAISTGRTSAGKRKPQQRRTNRGAPAAGAVARTEGAGAAAWLVYALIVILTLAGVWVFNFNVVYADMRFQQGQAFSEAPDPNQQLVAFNRYLDAIRLDPDEDFYYLNFGRTLMTLADLKRQQSPDLGQPIENATINDLLRLSEQEAQGFIASKSPLEILSYAEATLDRARVLNDRNKDHYANLARLNNFWYTLTGDKQRLYNAEQWYRRATEVAPQDVVIKAELSGTLITLGNYTEAEQVLAQSKALDPKYVDTDVRRADLLRAQGKLEEAVALYSDLISRNPHQLDSQIQAIVDQVQGQPELLQKLNDAYAAAAKANPNDDGLQNVFGLVAVRSGNLEGAAEAYDRAVKIQPNNLQYRRNYALVLSDTNRLPDALAQAKTALDIAQQQGPNAQSDVAAMQGLVQFFEAQIAAGG